MTDRLQAAIKQLGAAELEQITQMAELLVLRSSKSGSRKSLKLDWVGCMRDAPEQSGVEMAHRANEMRIEAIEKSMGK